MDTALIDDLAQQQQGQPPSEAPEPAAQKSQEASADDPNTQTPAQNQKDSGLTDEEKEKVLELRRTFKQRWASERRTKVRHVRRCFEVLRNRPFTVLDSDGFNFYDPFEQSAGLGDDQEDIDLYRANDNIYQMLLGSFQAALARSQSKTRYMPENADEELDVATARRASDAMAYIERRNKISKLQKLELLHFWTSGCWFSYTRYIVNADRAGVTKQPIIDLVPDESEFPDRYICKKCGDTVPAQSLSPFAAKNCPGCGAPLTEDSFFPGEVIPKIAVTGFNETPNGMVAIDVYGALNVDVAPDANTLFETPILDLEMETHVASLRASYPEAWQKLAQSGDASAEGETDRQSRRSATGQLSGAQRDRMPTFSRCWFHDWAFNEIDDKAIADSLKKKFPNGMCLVSANGDTFLEAKDEKLTDHWNHAAAQEGMGLYPPGVGDAALDVQDRINDVASIVHEHMDRTASPTILVDEDAINTKALQGQVMAPGTFTGIKRKQQNNRPLADLMYQPKFTVDANIYNYGENLIQLAQLIAGIRPEIFGGSDPNVQTASGQSQQLNQAVARMILYLDQLHEAHAERSEIAVKCLADNSDDDIRHAVEGDTDSGFENEYILLDELRGSFHAYPESDQGFPASYAEMRDQLKEMMSKASANPFVMEMMEVPDNQRIAANYLLPPGMKLPNESAMSKVKRVIAQLAQEQPQEVDGPMGPMFMPSVMPDKDVDDMELIRTQCIEWALKNYKLQQTNPQAFENVKAYMKLAGQYSAEAEAAKAATQAMVGQKMLPPNGGGGPPGGAPPASP